MRILLLPCVLLIVGLPACAHDNTYGFMRCYAGKHCPQNTLVFGIVVAEEANTFTVVVQKALRGEEREGKRIVLKNSPWNAPWNDRLDIGRQPHVGDALAVSYLQHGRMPYQPRYLIKSKTPDWRTMTIDQNRHSGDHAAIERFIRSGGIDDDYYFEAGNVFLRKRDGSTELIYSEPETAQHDSVLTFVRQRPLLLAASAGSLLLFLALLCWGVRRAGKQQQSRLE